MLHKTLDQNIKLLIFPQIYDILVCVTPYQVYTNVAYVCIVFNLQCY